MRDTKEQKKILSVVDKYNDYFNEWAADVSLGVKGTNFFYVLDAEHECFDVFCPFETAEELETLIIGDIASNLDTYIYADKELSLRAFDKDTVNDAYNNYDPKLAIKDLVQYMQQMAEINAKWADTMGRVYRSLANVGKVWDQDQAE